MRKILIVVDMQNDFIDGSLGSKQAVAIVDKVKEKILSYAPEDRFATMDTHGENYMETQEGKNLPVEDGLSVAGQFSEEVPAAVAGSDNDF